MIGTGPGDITAAMDEKLNFVSGCLGRRDPFCREAVAHNGNHLDPGREFAEPPGAVFTFPAKTAYGSDLIPIDRFFLEFKFQQVTIPEHPQK